jgi:hypothetical protein
MTMIQGYALWSGGNWLSSSIKERGFLTKHTLLVPPHFSAHFANELHQGKRML